MGDILCKSQQSNVNRRHPKEQRGPKFDEDISSRLVLKPLQQAHPAATRQPAVQAIAQTMNMEQRERQQEAIRLPNLPAGQQIHRVGGEVVVRQDRALGSPGGP